ncbi:MAG: hypothetical protein H7A23_00840 [Leptospiraceae bacterium]|nr:hypothetical protein [Leptospiraceae bacterium]MCP5493076.1 hypothetical protein [Leptospiraceae bacterium]
MSNDKRKELDLRKELDSIVNSLNFCRDQLIFKFQPEHIERLHRLNVMLKQISLAYLDVVTTNNREALEQFSALKNK